MAINPSHINTEIASRDYSNPDNDARAKLLHDAALVGIKGSQDNSDALVNFLLKKKQQENEIQKLKDMNLQPGMSGKVGDTSTSDMGVGKVEAMLQKNAMAKGDKDNANQANATKHAQDFYNSSSKQMEDATDSISTGLHAIQNNNANSLGILRAAILTSMGLKRFNEKEAMKSAPDSVKEQITAKLNSLGIPTEGNGNLTDIQVKGANDYFNGRLADLQDKHTALKAQALQSYQQSPYFDPNKAQALQASLGAPLDARLAKVSGLYGDVTKKYQDAQDKAAAAPPPNLPKMAGDAVQGLRNFLTGRGGQPDAPAAPQPQAPQVPQGIGQLVKPQPSQIRVKQRSTGQMGTIPADEFDATQYDRM